MSKLLFLKSLRLEWWQAGLYKLAMLAGGIFIGSRWPNIFYNWQPALLSIFLIAGGYILYLYFSTRKLI